MPKSKTIYSRECHWVIAHWDKILYLFFVAILFLFIPGQNVYTLPLPAGRPQVRELPISIPTPAPYPTNITGIYPAAEISAWGVIVFDITSGVYLYKRNEEIPLSPASTTKLMSALVALENFDPDDVVTIKSVANTGQKMGLVPGERITVENLLFGILIASGNDAAYALADYYPDGVSAFVAAMNQKAKEIGLSNTTFTNPVGYDEPGQKMTPLDLTRLAVAALDNRTIAKMVGIPQITVSDVTHTYFHPLKNINELLGKIPGVGGVKTGWTEQAGENLVTLVERNGHRLIAVVLKSRDRFADTTALIDWVFANYEWQMFSPSSELMK